MNKKINELSYAAPAPELDVVEWLNTPDPMPLSSLRGKVVVIHTFQMLCPSCILHSIPQANQLQEFYHDEDVQIIGLHTVFEHHEVMNLEALKAFIAQFHIRFPIAVDAPTLPSEGKRPKTMKKYRLEGTPTLIIIDQQGRIRLNHLGRLGNLEVGNFIGGLLAENEKSSEENILEDSSLENNNLENNNPEKNNQTKGNKKIASADHSSDGVCLANDQQESNSQESI